MEEKNNTTSEVNTLRKKYWFGNLLRKLIPHKKDRNLWIFSSIKGRYQDNSKYLFEYVSNNCPSIKAVYIVASEELKKELASLGLKAVVRDTKESKKVLRRAGVSFYTHGIDDFGNKVYNYTSYVVALWHGVGLKKIYYSDDTFKDNLIKKIYRNAFSYVHRDLTITTSKFCFDCFAKDFRLKKNSKYEIIGQPRNDVLFDTKKLQESGMKTILYVPTYRRFKKDDANIQKVVDMFSDINVQEKLYKLGYTIQVKLHPNTEGITINENKYLKNVQNKDSQDLLRNADIVITDYSSIVSDFAITRRKIIIFAPDYNEYVKSEPLFEESDSLYKSDLVCKTESEILNAISSNDTSLTDKINEMFNTSLEGNYCKRIVETICQKIKIRI